MKDLKLWEIELIRNAINKINIVPIISNNYLLLDFDFSEDIKNDYKDYNEYFSWILSDIQYQLKDDIIGQFINKEVIKNITLKVISLWSISVDKLFNLGDIK